MFFFGMTPGFRVAPSLIHGLGLFSERPFCEGEQVLDYIGERISKAESIRRCREGNPFIFYWNHEWDIDGSADSNLARFINHHCSPNCVVEPSEDRLCIIGTRPIALGEELTINYGYDLTAYRDYPCSCGAPNCVGYIVAEEFHDFVRNRTPRASPAEALSELRPVETEITRL